MKITAIAVCTWFAAFAVACGGPEQELATGSDALGTSAAGDVSMTCECEAGATCAIAYEDMTVVRGKHRNGDPKTDPKVKKVRKVTCGHVFWYDAQDGNGDWHLITVITTGAETTGVVDLGDGSGGVPVTFR